MCAIPGKTYGILHKLKSRLAKASYAVFRYLKEKGVSTYETIYPILEKRQVKLPGVSPMNIPRISKNENFPRTTCLSGVSTLFH
jgi:hypothetical protein